MKETYSDASELDGFDELNPEDREKIVKAFEDGHVAEEDIPESARKEGGEMGSDEEGEEKPKKKAATKRTKNKEGEEVAEKPKRSRTTKAKVRLFKSLCAAFVLTYRC